MPKRQPIASAPKAKRTRSNQQPPVAAVLQVDAPSTSFAFKFRTLAGTHTIDVRHNETNEVALARHFGVDARRIVLQVLDGESCVSVLDPFEIHHHCLDQETHHHPLEHIIPKLAFESD